MRRYFLILILFLLLIEAAAFPLMSKPTLDVAPDPDTAYQLIVKKSQRKLFLYNQKQKLLKTYKIALGFNPTGTKQMQGDGATPEGEYYITHKNAKSKFYRVQLLP